jgi:hypothetical protein
MIGLVHHLLIAYAVVQWVATQPICVRLNLIQRPVIQIVHPPSKCLYSHLEDGAEGSLRMAREALALALLGIHTLDAGPALIRGETFATDADLLRSHTGVEIDIRQLDPEWAVSRTDEPAVNLPAAVQEDEQWPSEVKLEESGWVQIRSTNRPQRNVELGDESQHTDENTYV